ncbi:MAG: hypothetical protein WD648_12960 [Planctomycetaceae bacterium]
MGICLQSKDIVVAGRFNPYIITPQWLAEQGVCAIDGDFELEFAFAVEARKAIVHFVADGVKWHVTDSRLTLSTTDPTRDPSAIAVAVMEKLPHTPVSAVGNNFHFKCDRRDWSGGHSQLNGKGFEELRAYGEPISISWSSLLQQSGVRVQIKFEESADHIEVHTNHHRDAGNCAQACQAAREFQSDFEKSKQLVLSITGNEVSQ